MTPPGNGDPYRDPYGQDGYGQDAPYGTDAYGSDPYGAGEQRAPREEPAWNPEPYAYPYERPAQDYRAAVDALADPLNDPLPSSGAEAGPRVPSWAPQATDTPQAQAPQPPPGGPGGADEGPSPWFRPSQPQQGQQQSRPPRHPQQGQRAAHRSPAAHPGPHAEQPAVPSQQSLPGVRPVAPGHGRPQQRRRPTDVDETAALPAVDVPDGPGPRRRRPERDRDDRDRRPAAASDASGTGAAAPDDDEHRTVALRRPSDTELGGRAARRKAAARGRGGRRGAPAEPSRPMTRLEARRAARAAKDGPVVLLSRAIGEVFITCGVLMLLFVAYQLWWTNVLAGQYAGGAKDSLTQKWEENPERKPGAFSPGQGFALLHIPKLDVVVPVAQGIDKQSVLDNGLAGHYDEKSGLKTAMPWDEQGNFGVAGHRNTHGEPFRYINRLVAGDEIIVETADTYYVYEMYSRLPSTTPANTSVLDPVPPQSGFKEPGRYLTLTTCTPEFTSKYRLIVWGRMVDERPRSEGKPDALVG